MSNYILAIDQGTTSSRAIVYDHKLTIKGVGQREFKQYYLASGHVKNDPEEIWRSVLTTYRVALKNAKVRPTQLKSIGITNQRETVVLWDRKTGKALYRAIVWHDRRTAEICHAPQAAWA